MLAQLKNLLTHSSVYSFGALLSKMLSFFMIPVYTRCLNAAAYGTLEILTLAATVISTLISLRAAVGIDRFYHECKTPDEKKRLVSTVAMFSLAVSVLAFLSLLPTTRALGVVLLHGPEYSTHFRIVFLSLSFELCYTVGYAFLRVRQQSVLFVAVSLLQLFMGLSLNIYFVVLRGEGVMGVLYSMAISSGLTACILGGYTFASVGFAFDVSQLWKVFKFSVPFVPAGIFMFVLNMGDRFLLNELGTLTEVGIYALGYKFGMIIGTLVGTPFLQVWVPTRVQIYHRSSDRDEIFSRVFEYAVVVFSVSGLLLSLLGKEVVALVATEEYFPACNVIPFVVLGYAFYALYYIVDIGIYLRNLTYWYSIITLIAAVANVGLNAVLIPSYGYMGAAFSTAASFLLCPLLTVIVSQKHYPVRYSLVRLAKILVPLCLCYAAGSMVGTGSLILDAGIKCGIVLCYGGILFLVGFLDEKERHFARQLWRRARGLPNVTEPA